MFPSNFRLKHFLAVIMLVVSILSACQPAPSSSSKVENQNSQALKFVIESKDIPGKWSWASKIVNQPSQAEWLNHENLSDSAASYLKGDYWVSGKSYYISVFHNVAQYSKPIPDSESPVLNSVFDSSKQINPPNFQTFSNKTEKACFDSDVYYDCTVVENYEFIKSYITIIAPKELGMQELESLLNSILKVGSSKFSHVEQTNVWQKRPTKREPDAAALRVRTSQAVSHALSFFWLDGFAVPAPAQVTQTVWATSFRCQILHEKSPRLKFDDTMNTS